MKQKDILGLSLILIGLLLIIISFKVLLGFGILIIIIGIFSLLNKNENKIEEINYRKVKRRK